ncbi:VOC family protein [Bacillus piscicola]|uniref:VOC family protein n=1 Tax=Bacillus piscicola TaxID=1632684 RepID=UPI001F08B066|nr:VOC family protein [Bacillus piscicola]
MGFHSKPNTFVNHVRIKVSNLERSLTYYQEMIGFSILEQTETTAKLTADGKTNILSLEQPAEPSPKQPNTTGLYHFAILLPHRSDLANIVQHFIEKNVRLGSSDHLVSEALYLTDPDGNVMEVYTDRDPASWQWNNGEVAMTVDPLDFRDLLSEVKQEESWQGLPAGTIMGHIHLHVSELQQTEEFYTKGLGFEVVNRFGDQALFISTGSYHHHIALNTWMGIGAPAPAKNSVGLEFYTLILPNEKSREKVAENLEKIGASVTEEKGTFITSDPSGNRIHLKV